jgi:hypothetical protein
VKRYIASSLKAAMEKHEDAEEVEEPKSKSAPTDIPTYHEKVDGWQVDPPDKTEVAPQIPDHGAEDQGTDYFQSFLDHQVFLETSKAYQWLLAKIRADARAIHQDISVLSTVRTKLREAFDQRSTKQSTSSTQVEFDVRVGVRQFLGYYYGDLDCNDLCSAVALTGSPDKLQAATCEQYLTQTWSSEAVGTLKAIEKALTRGSSSGKNSRDIAFCTRRLTRSRNATIWDVVLLPGLQW